MKYYCIFYEEKVKKGRYVVWVKKVLILLKRGKVLYDGELKVSKKLEDLLNKSLTLNQYNKFKNWLLGFNIKLDEGKCNMDKCKLKNKFKDKKM